MYGVQNQTLQNIATPALLLSAAFVAGRYIQYFPGASKGGLFLSAALGSASVMTSQWMFPDKSVHTGDHFDLFSASTYRIALRVTLSLGIATLITPLAAKALKGRVTYTVKSVFALGLIELVGAGSLALFFFQRLKAEHENFREDSYTWFKEKGDDISNLIKQFYFADFSPPAHVSIPSVYKGNPLAAYRDFSKMSRNQLEWHLLMSQAHVEYEPKDLFSLWGMLKRRRSEYDIHLHFHRGIMKELIDYAIGKGECIEILHHFFSWDGNKLHKHKRAIFLKEVYEAKLPPFVIEALNNNPFDDRDFSMMDMNQLKWHLQMYQADFAYEPKELFALWIALESKEQSMELNKEGITKGLVEYAKNHPECANLLQRYFNEYPLEFNMKEGKVFNAGEMVEIDRIPYLDQHIQQLDSATIKHLNKYELRTIKRWVNDGEEDNDKESERWNMFAPHQKFALVIAGNKIGVTHWRKCEITQAVVNMARYDKDVLKRIFYLYQHNSPQFALDVKAPLRAQLNEFFARSNREPIKEINLPFTGYELVYWENLKSWNDYFMKHRDVWNGLKADRVTSFINYFIRKEYPEFIAFRREHAGLPKFVLPLDRVEFNMEELTLPRVGEVAQITDHLEIEWYLAVLKRYPNFNKELLEAMEKQALQLD